MPHQQRFDRGASNHLVRARHLIFVSVVFVALIVIICTITAEKHASKEEQRRLWRFLRGDVHAQRMRRSQQRDQRVDLAAA